MQTQDLIASLEQINELARSELHPSQQDAIRLTLRQAITHITTQDALLGEVLLILSDSSETTPNRVRDAKARITAHLRPVDPLVEALREAAWSILESRPQEETLRAIATDLHRRGIGKEVVNGTLVEAWEQ